MENSFKIDYAKIYFTEEEANLRTTNGASKLRMAGVSPGLLTSNDSNFLNLKKCESGDKNLVVLHRLLEFIYVTYKCGMYAHCVEYISYFFNFCHRNLQDAFTLSVKDNINQIFKVLEKGAFKADLLISSSFQSQPTAMELLFMLQVLFWLKVTTLLRSNEEKRILEAFVQFGLYAFKPFKLEGLKDKASCEVFKSMFRILFINKNYKQVEAYLKPSAGTEIHQHWMVGLHTVLQTSYYEVCKCFYNFNEDVSTGLTPVQRSLCQNGSYAQK